MTDYRTVGAHQLNKWLWWNLNTFTYRDFSSGQDLRAFAGYDSIGLVPIIPTQQVPEMNNIVGGAPFIVYAYTRTAAAQSWWVNSEQCTYIVYDNDEERLRAVHTYMTDLLKRFDETARAVNNYLGAASKFDFKWIGLASSVGPEAAIQENGRQGAMVSIRYEYTCDIIGTVHNQNLGMRI